MKPLSAIDLADLVNLAATRPRPGHTEHVPVDATGLPADRTLCPWCVGRVIDCKRCNGTGIVCPTCRGSRVQRVDSGPRPAVVACDGCTDWADHREHRWDEHGWPVFQRVLPREAAVIRHYWRRAAA